MISESTVANHHPVAGVIGRVGSGLALAARIWQSPDLYGG
jgi:hypothetical protein